MELSLKKLLPIGLIILAVMFVMKMMKGRRCEGFTQQTAPNVECNCNVEKFTSDPVKDMELACQKEFPYKNEKGEDDYTSPNFTKYMNCTSCGTICNYNDEECVENCMACQENCKSDDNDCKKDCDMKTRCTDRLPKIKEMSGDEQKKAINDWLVEHDMTLGYCKSKEE